MPNYLKYADIKRLLDAAIGGPGEEIGFHGAFWRFRTRDEFVRFTYRGEVLLSDNGAGGFDPDASNLIKALEGRAPFGSDQGVAGARFPRMPAGMAPMPATDIRAIRDWIAAGCPA